MTKSGRKPFSPGTTVRYLPDQAVRDLEKLQRQSGPLSKGRVGVVQFQPRRTVWNVCVRFSDGCYVIPWQCLRQVSPAGQMGLFG